MKLRKATHVSEALKPVLDSLGIRGDSVKKELLDENISGCCGAPLVTSAAGTQTKYVCSQCRRTERIG
jgi:hypothetical protein